MKARHLLLILMCEVWLAVDFFAFSIRHRSMVEDIHQASAQFAALATPPHLALWLLGLSLGRLPWSVIGAGVLMAAIQIAIGWLVITPVEGLDQIMLWQLMALPPVIAIARLMGFGVIRVAATSELDRKFRYQFSIAHLMLWTSGAGIYLALIVRLDLSLDWADLLLATVFPILLVCLTLWATLICRRLSLGAAVLVVSLVGCGKLGDILVAPPAWSAWGLTMFYASQALLCWMTCLTLRAFGYRLTRLKALAGQPPEPASAN